MFQGVPRVPGTSIKGRDGPYRRPQGYSKYGRELTRHYQYVIEEDLAMPVDPRAERICKMIESLVSKHYDQIDECSLDWTVIELSSEHSGKVQFPAPLFNMKFRKYY